MSGPQTAKNSAGRNRSRDVYATDFKSGERAGQAQPETYGGHTMKLKKLSYIAAALAALAIPFSAVSAQETATLAGSDTCVACHSEKLLLAKRTGLPEAFQ